MGRIDYYTSLNEDSNYFEVDLDSRAIPSLTLLCQLFYGVSISIVGSSCYRIHQRRCIVRTWIQKRFDFPITALHYESWHAFLIEKKIEGREEIHYTHVVMPLEVLLKPLENIVAALEGKNTLIQIGALSPRETRNVMKVDRNLPHPWECLGGTGFDLALVRDSVVQRVRPNGLIGGLRTDRAVPEKVGLYQSLQSRRRRAQKTTLFIMLCSLVSSNYDSLEPRSSLDYSRRVLTVVGTDRCTYFLET